MRKLFIACILLPLAPLAYAQPSLSAIQSGNNTGQGNLDRLANSNYASAVATGNGNGQRSQTYYFLQSLMKWFPTIQAGVPLPI